MAEFQSAEKDASTVKTIFSATNARPTTSDTSSVTIAEQELPVSIHALLIPQQVKAQMNAWAAQSATANHALQKDSARYAMMDMFFKETENAPTNAPRDNGSTNN